MAYLPNTEADQQAMLREIGAASMEELLESIPAELRLQRPLDLPPALGELELTALLERLAAANLSTQQAVCFLGAGAYDHFVPAVVDFVASRSEFYTAYTPYQPEASQGTLQAMFEYQTLITQLTALEVSNASLYDGASATAEAVLMALAAGPGRNQVLVAESLHPEYRQVLGAYLANIDVEIQTVPTPNGVLELASFGPLVSQHTACVVVQHPNFFGCLEDVQAAADVAHQAGALLVQVFDPISLGVLRPPGQLGADIAVAEGQCLGNHLSFGGPYLGIIACREQFMRRMPGRLVGQTLDRRGRRCWVLTLQTREQHIRREKATSNICTNQGLLALRAAVYLAVMGPHGLRGVAELCVQKAAYARQRLAADAKIAMAFPRPTFKEFAVRLRHTSIDKRLAEAQQQGILAGVPLGRWYPDLADCLLVAVTEKRTKDQIDRLCALLTN